MIYELRTPTGSPVIKFETELRAKEYQLHYANRIGVKLALYRIKTIEERVA